MSCNLTLYRTEPCKDSVGGLDKVYFVNYSSSLLSTITFDTTNTDAIESITGTPSAYEYDIKGTSSLSTDLTLS